MAKKIRTEIGLPTPSMPSPGSVFVTPLADGRFGVCRVLRTVSGEEATWVGEDCVLVAASPWIGDAAPDLSDPQLRKVLRLTHHGWQNEPAVHWVEGPPPRSFRYLGSVPLKPSETRRRCKSLSTWDGFPYQILLQWRWEHDREAVLAEDARAERRRARKRERAAERHKVYLAGLTLAGLRRKRFFHRWSEFAEPELVKEARRILYDTIDELQARGPGAKRRTMRAVFRSCVERFNQLDRRGGFVCSDQCEDVLEHFYEIVHASGFANYHESRLADEWRDW